MPRIIKILLLFEIGIVSAIIFFGCSKTAKTLPIFSHLPDLVFPSKKQEPTLTLIFTGDVMLGRSVNTQILSHSDPAWPFQKISSVLSQADLTIINLESPFVKGCKPTDEGMTFCSDPNNVKGLVSAGVDYASIANNHSNNYGNVGIEDTKTVLTSNNIVPLEQGKADFKTVKNTKIAFIAFSDLPYVQDDIVKTKISEASRSADLVIVLFHWGIEYQTQPSKRQIFLAHLAIDSGADVVVGHHPHVVQSEESYNGKPIFYSLGNLVFDQMWSEATTKGEIVKLSYQKRQLIKKEIIPTKISNYGQPSLVTN